mgnify:FL=1
MAYRYDAESRSGYPFTVNNLNAMLINFAPSLIGHEQEILNYLQLNGKLTTPIEAGSVYGNIRINQEQRPLDPLGNVGYVDLIYAPPTTEAAVTRTEYDDGSVETVVVYPDGTVYGIFEEPGEAPFIETYFDYTIYRARGGYIPTGAVWGERSDPIVLSSLDEIEPVANHTMPATITYNFRYYAYYETGEGEVDYRYDSEKRWGYYTVENLGAMLDNFAPSLRGQEQAILDALNSHPVVIPFEPGSPYYVIRRDIEGRPLDEMGNVGYARLTRNGDLIDYLFTYYARFVHVTSGFSLLSILVPLAIGVTIFFAGPTLLALMGPELAVGAVGAEAPGLAATEVAASSLVIEGTALTATLTTGTAALATVPAASGLVIAGTTLTTTLAAGTAALTSTAVASGLVIEGTALTATLPEGIAVLSQATPLASSTSLLTDVAAGAFKGGFTSTVTQATQGDINPLGVLVGVIAGGAGSLAAPIASALPEVTVGEMVGLPINLTQTVVSSGISSGVSAVGQQLIVGDVNPLLVGVSAATSAVQTTSGQITQGLLTPTPQMTTVVPITPSIEGGDIMLGENGFDWDYFAGDLDAWGFTSSPPDPWNAVTDYPQDPDVWQTILGQAVVEQSSPGAFTNYPAVAVEPSLWENMIAQLTPTVVKAGTTLATQSIAQALAPTPPTAVRPPTSIPIYGSAPQGASGGTPLGIMGDLTTLLLLLGGIAAVVTLTGPSKNRKRRR